MLILDKIEELNKSKQWTRVDLNNYTINDLLELDELLNNIEDLPKEELDEIVEKCKEMNNNKERNIIALYLLGFIGIGISEKLIFNSYLASLVSLFFDKYKKINLTKHICEKILNYTEDKRVLEVLAECFEMENNQEKALEFYKKIAEIDQNDPDIAKRIAKIEESKDNMDLAIEYYKKSIYRYLQKKYFNNFKEILSHLINLNNNDLKFFDSTIEQVLDSFPYNNSEFQDKIISILEEVCLINQEYEKWDNCIRYTKKILEIVPNNKNYKTQLIDYYRKKYAHHSKFDVYIQKSDLNSNFRSVAESIKIFEKYMKFDVDSYVLHNNWGIGIITETTDEKLIINFKESKNNHSMNFEMASTSLTPLSKNHFFVYEITKKKSALSEKIKKDVGWFLKVYKHSFGNYDTKEMKKLLVTKYLTQNEWNSYLGKIKEHQNKKVINKSKELDITKIDKMYISEFKKAKNYNERLKRALEYICNEDLFKELIKSDAFNLEIISYFFNMINSIDFYYNLTPEQFSSYFFMQYLLCLQPDLKNKYKMDQEPSKILQECIEKDNLKILFEKTKSSILKKSILKYVKENIDNWTEIYIDLLPCYMQKNFILELVNEGYLNDIKDAFLTYTNLYKEQREFFVWFFKTFKREEWFPNEDRSLMSNIIFNMLKLLTIANEDIKSKRNSVLNKKIINQINSLFFKENIIFDYIQNSTEKECEHLYYILVKTPAINHIEKDKVYTKIKELYSDINLDTEKESGMKIYYQELDPNIFLLLPKSLTKMKKDMDYIVNVELPKNAKEIDEARQQGDLKENAEYKAARERQALLSSQAKTLKESIQKAKVVKRNDVTTDYVGFGNNIKLKNLIEDTTEEYTVLGLAESDTEKNIISYQSPLIKNLLGKKAGEEINYVINGTKYSYKVLEIGITDLVE